jgi:hypothetical protein
MKSCLRRSLGLCTLIVYLTINVIGAALHHHGPEESSSGWMTALVTDPEELTEEPGDDDDDDHNEDSCLVCSVLHLAQNPPTVIHVQAVAGMTGDAVSAAAVSRSYPLQSATRSRAPPRA